MSKSRFDKKGSSEEFATATHLLLGTILFTVIAVALMFFFVSQEIQATFTAARIDAEIISTRIIFSRNCYAYGNTIVVPWFFIDDDRASNTFVRAGIIDIKKFGHVEDDRTDSQNRIKECAPYNVSRAYEYNISLENLNNGRIYFNYPNPLRISNGDADNCPVTQSSAYIKKIYPVLIYNSTKSEYSNGVLDIRIRFCYLNESVKK